MDVVFAAGGWAVAESGGSGFDGGNDVSFGVGFFFPVANFVEGVGGDVGACPSAKVFGCEVFSGDGFEVVVDVAGVYGLAVAFFVVVLEEFVAGDVLAAFDDFG